jgi:hypothetical protein
MTRALAVRLQMPAACRHAALPALPAPDYSNFRQLKPVYSILPANTGVNGKQSVILIM